MKSITYWPTFLYNHHHTGAVSDLLLPPLRLAWKTARPGYVLSGPVIVNQMVYVCNQTLFALDLASGAIVWETPPLGLIGLQSAIVWNNIVIVCGDGALYAVDALSGQFMWQIPSNCHSQSPAVSNNRVFWSGNRSLHCADIESGYVHWSFDAQIFRCVPTVSETMVYIAGESAVFALDVTTGQVQWKWSKDRVYLDVRTTVLLVDDVVVVPLRNYGLVALDTTSGVLRWEYGQPLCNPLTAATFADGVVYVGGNRLYAVAVNDGSLIWRSDELGLRESAPVLVGDYVYIGGGLFRCVYGLDRRTGQHLWRYETQDMVLSTAAYSQGYLVIGSHDGFVYCFTQDETA